MSTKKSVMLRNLTKGSRATRNTKAELLEGTLARGYTSVINQKRDDLANARKNLFDLENITVDYSGDVKTWAKNHAKCVIEIELLEKEIDKMEDSYTELFG